MKIHPDQLEGVRPDSLSQTNKAKPASTAFGDLLTQEVAKSGTDTAKTSALLPPPGGLGALSALMGVNAVESVAPTQQAEKAIMEKVENLLDKWDQYAQNLQGSSGQVDLKKAYGVLQDIDGTVQQIKGENPNLAQQSPTLQGVVSELEVLAVTERIKFNRGDYLS
ncbi:MAG: hypothetical protein RDU24_06120 [Humidesulfovibrio sp.]|uniref:hypothetical protein n=1 Tax=Humidesulfovibrio sp. TaxID=2910988 RepID=UPI0027F9967D|nr:hypothetical protein [Humidesulfovibrio sp.]MDQ7834940.1 hypothetical protein [Humidesulfovibrio sp.]